MWIVPDVYNSRFSANAGLLIKKEATQKNHSLADSYHAVIEIRGYRFIDNPLLYA